MRSGSDHIVLPVSDHNDRSLANLRALIEHMRDHLRLRDPGVIEIAPDHQIEPSIESERDHDFGCENGRLRCRNRQPHAIRVQRLQELFDARVSDTISLAAGNKTVLDVTFLRLNQRHHSVAIAATRGRPLDMFRTRINHFNIEVATVDDLSFAHERCAESGFKITRGVGRHPNDQELSFYMMTPSGFELEIGWDALTVEEASWQEGKSYSNMSTWGHDIPGRFSSELGISHVVQIIRSLSGKEYLPW